MVSHKHKCIFIHIPKTGGETITSLFDDIDNDIPKHANAKQIKNHLGNRIWSQYYKFSVVRNPFDLVVSMYEHLRKPLYQKEVFYKKYGTYTARPVNAFKIAINGNFDHYCEIIFKEKQVQEESRKKLWPVNHFAPQFDWISDHNNKILVDNILYFEDFVNQLNSLFSDLNLNKNVSVKLNSSKRQELFNYYDNPYTKNLIREYYEVDFRKFKYKDSL